MIRSIALILLATVFVEFGITSTSSQEIEVLKCFKNPESCSPKTRIGSAGPSSSINYKKGLDAAKRGDFVTALSQWKPLADQGNARAQNNLGKMYRRGHGVPQNYKTAVKWYTLAAEQGYARAQGALGELYVNGHGVPRDYETAVMWFRLAANHGDARAQGNLGVMYANGHGVPENNTTAAKWYTLAAEQGYDRAQSNLGLIHEEGIGVPKDNEAAAKWYTLAAKQGDVHAQYKLGIMYVSGRGVPKNDKTALMWWKLAADQEHAISQYNLGVIYANGNGVPKDDKTAVTWWRRAADQGHAGAQFNLGMMYEEGRGIPQDNDTAAKWYTLAAKQGDIDAAKAVTQLQEKIFKLARERERGRQEEIVERAEVERKRTEAVERARQQAEKIKAKTTRQQVDVISDNWNNVGQWARWFTGKKFTVSNGKFQRRYAYMPASREVGGEPGIRPEINRRGAFRWEQHSALWKKVPNKKYKQPCWNYEKFINHWGDYCISAVKKDGKNYIQYDFYKKTSVDSLVLVPIPNERKSILQEALADHEVDIEKIRKTIVVEVAEQKKIAERNKKKRKEQAEGKRKEKARANKWKKYSNREKTVLEEVYNYSISGNPSGTSDSFWVEKQKCIVALTYSKIAAGLFSSGFATKKILDHRKVNRTAFIIEKKNESYTSYGVTGYGTRTTFSDREYLYLWTHTKIDRHRAEKAWTLAFLECPGKKSRF